MASSVLNDNEAMVKGCDGQIDRVTEIPPSHASEQSRILDSTDPVENKTADEIIDETLYEPSLGVERDSHQFEGSLTKRATATNCVEPENIANPARLRSVGALAKYRSATTIPTFAELHARGEITLKDPLPGDLQFPGSFDANGYRIPIREVFRQPEQSILPSHDKPLWKQMLAYCQIWGVWASKVEDDRLRSELINWVTKRMQDAWKIGIENGHCGEPNGHTQCCLTCESSNKKLVSQRETRKRPVDSGKQPAPFACEISRHSYSILNRELEEAGVTMDSVVEQLTPQTLEAGKALLEEMHGLLNRDHLQWSDWTIVKLHKFDPRVSSRNLLMFCLWEVERCQNIMRSAEQTLAKPCPSIQQKQLQKRIEINRQRGDQHLVLAHILNNKSSQESDNVDEGEESSDDQSSQVFERPRRSMRVPKPVQIVQIISDGETNESVVDSEIEGENDNLSPTDQPGNHAPSGQVNMNAEIQHKDAQPVLARTTPDHQLKLDSERLPDTQNAARTSSHFDALLVTNDAREDAKPRNIEGDTPPCGVSPAKTDIRLQARNSHVNTASIVDYSGVSYGTSYETESKQNEDASQGFLQTLQDHAQVANHVEASDPPAHLTTNMQRYRQQYILQQWQPWLNSILIGKGLGSLGWNMENWYHINYILEQLNYGREMRAALLNRFNDGFNVWFAHLTQPPVSQVPQAHGTHLTGSDASPIHGAQVLSTGAISKEKPNFTRGFSFRYSSMATQAERDHVDNCVHDYVSFIMHSKTQRFGYYAVFMNDPNNPESKVLAHGIWNLQKHKKVEDADWFYSNQSRPASFRVSEQRIYHDWGYSIPPSKSKSKHKAPLKRSTFSEDEFDNDGIDYRYATNDSGSLTSKRSSMRNSKTGTNAGSRKRRRIVESDGDSDSD